MKSGERSFRIAVILWLAAEPPRLPLRRELSDCVQDLGGTTEGERTRGRCLLRGADEHRVKKRSFAFALVYIKCFRTYSVYLSLRLPAQILYAGIHLPPQREARALPRHALKSTASERKIVTKETHQGCVFVQVAFALQRRGKGAPAPYSDSAHKGSRDLLTKTAVRKVKPRTQSPTQNHKRRFEYDKRFYR